MVHINTKERSKENSKVIIRNAFLTQQNFKLHGMVRYKWYRQHCIVTAKIVLDY